MKSKNNQKLRSEYDSRLELYNSLLSEAQFIIKNKIERDEIKIHNLSGRIKTYESVSAKLSKKKKNLKEQSLSMLNDVVGLRIVCLFLDDIPKIQNSLSSVLDVVESDDKIFNTSHSEFGYMSLHLNCKLKNEYSGPRYDLLKNNVFEIQIRTIAMDAWASISHYMDYKNEFDIPSHLKRSFHALSGLLHVADLQFKELHDAKIKFSELLKTKLIEEKISSLINFDSLKAYLEEKYGYRDSDDSATISDLIHELGYFKIKTLERLEELRLKNEKAALESEKLFPPTSIVDEETLTNYTQVGFIRTILECEFGNHELMKAYGLSEL